jgi:hypothetical protein
MSVLELGAAEKSYLPENLNLARHVGVGLNDKLMEENPSLTEKVIVDLNKVLQDGDVDSDELRLLKEEPFDVIIMANTADYLMHPREVFKSVWLLLKPGGTCINAFSTNKAFGDKFTRAQTRMWQDYNDDQHMWVAGSFYQFSAGEGWENVRGFDISPESAKDNFEDNGPLKFLEKGKDNNMYVVQANKGFQEETIDEADPAKSINSKMWMLPTMEDRDKKLVVPRLGRSYSLTKNPERKGAIRDHIQYLPKIYEALIKMDTFAFTFQMQSQLAADLVLDPDFDANDEQIKALKEGVSTLFFKHTQLLLLVALSVCPCMKLSPDIIFFFVSRFSQDLDCALLRPSFGNQSGNLPAKWISTIRSIFFPISCHVLEAAVRSKKLRC